jgi:hypothetical protein
MRILNRKMESWNLSLSLSLSSSLHGIGTERLFRLQKSAHLYSGRPWLLLPLVVVYAKSLLGSLQFSIRCTRWNHWCLYSRILFLRGILVGPFWYLHFGIHPTECGRAMAQAVSRRPLTAEVRVHARVNPCEICGGQSGTGTGFLSEFFGFPLSVSFHRRCPYSYHLENEHYVR